MEVKAGRLVRLDNQAERVVRRVRPLERGVRRPLLVTRPVYAAISSVVARGVRSRRPVPRCMTGVSATMRASTTTCV